MIVLFMLLAGMLLGLFGSAIGKDQSALGSSGQSHSSALAAQTRIRQYGALNLAEVGSRLALEYMNEGYTLSNTTINTVPASFFDTADYASVTGTGWSKVYFDNPAGSNPATQSNLSLFYVHICPYNDSADTLHQYIIEAVGVYQGTTTQIVRASVRVESFANYAYFINSAPSGLNLMAGKNVFGGPVHINDTSSADAINVYYDPNGATDDGTGGGTIFDYPGTGSFTTSGPSVNWYTTSGAAGAPSSWSNVMTNGSPQYSTSQLSFNQTADSAGNYPQAYDAYGNTDTAPTSFNNSVELNPATSNATTTLGGVGVSIPSSGGVTTGGIVINGNVNQVLFSVGTPSTTQQIAIYQTSTTDSGVRMRTVINVDQLNNDTSWYTEWAPAGTANTWYEATPGGNVQTLTGVTNGVVYAENGNIGAAANATTSPGGGVSGVIADNYVSNGTIVRQNSWTVAVNPADPGGSTMYLDGDLTYNTMESNGANPLVSGMLGLVGENITIGNYYYNPNTATISATQIEDMYIAATSYAANVMQPENYSTRTPGQLTLFGGYISGIPGDFSTEYLTGPNAGKTESGFVKANDFDDRTQTSPPPGFPDVGNDYIMTSYERTTETIDGTCTLGGACSF
jgi:hypothetical protein